MDIEKLIEQLNDFNENHISVLCGSGQCACGYLCDKDDCIVVRAATALSTLQAENEKLRADLENYRKGHCSEGGCAAEKDRDTVMAELEQVKRCIEIVENQRDQMKRERDAAIDCIYKVEDALDRGNDNDWAREHISEWESQKED